MAGIGFELRKIFGKKTLFSSIKGSIYAAMTTIGTSIVFIILLLSFNFIMDYFNAAEMEKMFFVSSFTYIFLIAILVSAVMNTVLSRYISDCIFEKREKDICASVFGTLTVGSVVSGLGTGILCIGVYFHDQPSPWFLAMYYLLGVLACNTYNLITYISALKEYKEVTLSYFLGIVLAIPAFLVLYRVLGISMVLSAYTGLVIGFFFTDFLLVYRCLKAFGLPGRNYFAFLGYFKRFKRLIISGGAYMLGFYISNIIYWFLSDMRLRVSIFSTAPNYDMAMFLAILVNLTSLVIFVVKTETAFFDKYVMYLSAINNGTYTIIEKERESMINTLRLQLFFVYEVQLIITLVLICLANIMFPYLGISSAVLNMFIILGLGLYCTFCMYFTVIFLYYFEDHTSACIGPCVFLAIVTVLSVICARAGEVYYPIPLLAGGVIGWTVSFLCLRYRLARLNEFLMCR